MILIYQACLLICAIGLALVAWRVRGPTGMLFAIMSLMSSVVPIIAGSGLNLVKYDEFALLRRTPDQTIALIVSVALFGTLTGYFIKVAMKLQHSQEPITARASPRSLQRYLQVSCALLLIIALGLAAIAPGGIVGVVTANINRIPQENSFSSLIYAASIMYGYCVTALLITCVNRGTKLPLLHLLFSTLIFWAMGGRVQFASIVITYGLLLLRYGRLSKLTLGLLSLPVAFAMNLILVLRLESQGAAERAADSNLFKLFDQLSMIGTYDLTAQYVAKHGYNPFLYPSMIFQLIPRGIYPNKPDQISRIFRSEYFFDNLGGIPPGLWGEFLISGDLIGELVLGALFGLLIATVDMRIRNAPRYSVTGQALCFSLVPILSIFAVRGGLDNSIFRIVIVLFATAMLWAVERKLVRSRLVKLPRLSKSTFSNTSPEASQQITLEK